MDMLAETVSGLSTTKEKQTHNIVESVCVTHDQSYELSQ